MVCMNWLLPLLNKFTIYLIMEEKQNMAAMHTCRRARLLLQIAGGPCFAALTAASVNTRTYFITVLIYQ